MALVINHAHSRSVLLCISDYSLWTPQRVRLRMRLRPLIALHMTRRFQPCNTQPLWYHVCKGVGISDVAHRPCALASCTKYEHAATSPGCTRCTAQPNVTCLHAHPVTSPSGHVRHSMRHATLDATCDVRYPYAYATCELGMYM